MLEAKHDSQTGQLICDFVNSKSSLHLLFEQWTEENVYARNKGAPHVIIGGWYGETYIVRGLVKPKRKGQRFRWFPNGQASTGSEQVGLFGEEDELNFYDFEKVAESYHKVINEAAARRSDREGTYILKYVGAKHLFTPLVGVEEKVKMTGKEAIIKNRELDVGWRYVLLTPTRKI
jgi:hypothetical protein